MTDTTRCADDFASIAARLRELEAEAMGGAAETPGIPSFSSMGPVGPPPSTPAAAASLQDCVYIQAPNLYAQALAQTALHHHQLLQQSNRAIPYAPLVNHPGGGISSGSQMGPKGSAADV